MRGLVRAALLASAMGLLLPPVWAGQLVGEESNYAREQGFDEVFTYVAAGNGAGQIEYQCLSQPGKLTSASTWQIRKFTYDSSNRISGINWANGTDGFTLVCDSAATYDYTP